MKNKEKQMEEGVGVKTKAFLRKARASVHSAFLHFNPHAYSDGTINDAKKR